MSCRLHLLTSLKFTYFLPTLQLPSRPPSSLIVRLQSHPLAGLWLLLWSPKPILHIGARGTFLKYKSDHSTQRAWSPPVASISPRRKSNLLTIAKWPAQLPPLCFLNMPQGLCSVIPSFLLIISALPPSVPSCTVEVGKQKLYLQLLCS